MSRRERTALWRMPLLVWLALLALLAATALLAFVPMGGGNLVVSLAIGATKVVLIALFFMQLNRTGATIGLASLAGLIFLFTLFLLSFGDYLTRPLG